MQKNLEPEQIKLCKNCFNCKKKKNKVYCKIGYFKISADIPIIYTPYDFDCYEYDEM